MGEAEVKIFHMFEMQTQRLREDIEQERQAREETEDAMTRMVEDIVVKMQQELLQERKEREQDEEMLLKILEDTCIRLNSGGRDLSAARSTLGVGCVSTRTPAPFKRVPR